MKTIIIDNILTPYEIARYNKIDDVLKGNLEVWFQKETEQNRNWIQFPPIHFRYLTLHNIFGLIRLLNSDRGKIERIIYCGWDSPFYLYALLFSKTHKIRSTLWSGSTMYEKSILRKLIKPYVKFIINNTDDYICYGTRAKQYLINLGANEKKIKIFLNSVDIDFFRLEIEKLRKSKKELKRKYNIPDKDKVILFVGQLIDRKGVKELLVAYNQFVTIHKNWSLLIAGEGELQSTIKSFIAQHPSSKIRLLGFIDYFSLPEIYTVSNVLILPSKEEVWGLVVNEALASGLPVIVGDAAGCSVDLVNPKSGIIIPEITPEAIIHVLYQFVKKRYTIAHSLIDKMKIDTYLKENFQNE